MRAALTIAILLAASVSPAPVRAAEPVLPATAPPPVITCTSLANLRSVLRGVGDDAAAAVPAVTDPKSDLGCSVLDRKTVTGISDHVALNGRAYDCLSLQNTGVCHWVVAGSAAAPEPSPARAAPAGKGRR